MAKHQVRVVGSRQCIPVPHNAFCLIASGNNVFDLSQLEGSKENIQPLKKGRNPKQLLHALEVQNKAGNSNSLSWSLFPPLY